jgi:hypothetical protein
VDGFVCHFAPKIEVFTSTQIMTTTANCIICETHFLRMFMAAICHMQGLKVCRACRGALWLSGGARLAALLLAGGGQRFAFCQCSGRQREGSKCA